MRKLHPLLCLTLCLLLCIATAAQKQIVYPTAQALRTSLLKLFESKKNAFQDIKGALLYERTTVQYFDASLHIVPNDTPRIAEDTNPIQVYYLDFFNKELDEPVSKTVFAAWQKLILESLPGYTMKIDGNQYPDLESMAFTSPDGSNKLTLYRNGSKDKCQVSIVIMNNNLDEIRAAYGKKPTKPVMVNPVPKKDSVKTTKKEPVITEPSEMQIRTQKTLTKLFNDRLNDFRSFKGGVITTKGTVKYVAKGTDYPYEDDIVEYIEVQPKQVVYTVIFFGEFDTEESAAAYRQVLTAAHLKQGYKYNAVQENGKTKTYSISYKGVVVSKCIYIEDGDESETSITISGR